MNRIIIWTIGMFLVTLTSCEQESDTAETGPSWQLVWSDEFEEEGLPDPERWSYDVGTACEKPAGCGWGNNELQYYTENRKENARVEEGHLIIEAHKEPYKEDREYTSARLVSKGNGDWKYGKIEMRAMLPQGFGTWAAFWMLPTQPTHGGWPSSGEIDILEYVGYAQDTVYGTVHTDAYNGMIGTQRGGEIHQEGVESDFHTYSIEWDEDDISWYLDGKQYFHFKNEKTGNAAWPFDHAFHLILNLAVGGHWGGSKGIDPDIWPQQYVIDYVRVYQSSIQKPSL